MKRKLTLCKAVASGKVEVRGKSTIEFYGKDGDPQEYCWGWVDCMTDEPLQECKECPDFARKAEEDMKGESNEKHRKIQR